LPEAAEADMVAEVLVAEAVQAGTASTWRST
jgi:hypothetical protein